MTALEQKFLIKDKKTGKLEAFEIAKIFLNDKSDSYGILLENPIFVLRVTGYSNGSFSINNFLGEAYEIPEETQKELTKIIQLKKRNYAINAT